VSESTHHDGLSSALGHLPYASLANVGVRRHAFDAVGECDPSFSNADDDIDFSWRVQYAGFSIGPSPVAVVHYRYRDTLNNLMRQLYGYARANETLYVKHRRLGYITAPPRARYKVAAFQVLRLVVRLPDLLSGRRC
jgi:GT2 family glycosyltransferase